MVSTSWQHCIDCLKVELPAQQYNTWIRPLKANIDADVLQISAPNRFILDWVKGKFLRRIEELVTESSGEPLQINLEVFDLRQQEVATPPTRAQSAIQQSSVQPLAKQIVKTATEAGGLEEQQPLLEKIQKNGQSDLSQSPENHGNSDSNIAKYDRNKIYAKIYRIRCQLY